MRRRFVVPSLWVAYASTSLVGCFGVIATDRVRTRHAAEFGCNEDHVTVDEINATTYRATGCGSSVIYVCGGGGRSEISCVRDSAPETEAPTLPPPRPQSYRHVEREQVTFDVPSEVERDVDSWRFSDPRGRVSISLVVAEHSGDAEAWVDAKYPDAKKASRTVQGDPLLYAWRTTKRFHWWAAVGVSGGSVYELTCSGPIDEAAATELCGVVMKSFHFVHSTE